MATTADPPDTTVETAQHPPLLARGEGVELLGPVHGSGYRDGAALVRRGDGQMVQLGPLMYALLEAVDGSRDGSALAEAVSERVAKRVEVEDVAALAKKLAAQGLLAGFEQHAPPKRNPLLALRWKVLVTDPVLTRRLTAPFTFLFRPWLMWPILAAFAGVFWFVLFHKGVAGATAQAFHSPGLLVLVFALAVASAGFHELGHASAARYGGATPGGMGMGIYLVWPAFYTDVTDTYRLPRRDRLRVDLGGLYFNAVVAVVTMGIWLLWRQDALLLLIALQVLQMVKQLSPIIRADGYHILSDATGVPDLFSHMGPTLRSLLPRHRDEPAALGGWQRWLVTAWVLIVVPVLLSLAIGAILVLPKLVTSAWDSGRVLVTAIPHEVSHAQVIDVLASLVRLLALTLPVLGSALVTQKIVRTTWGRARSWSAGSPVRRGVALAGAGLALAGVAWAWWPSGQYQPVRPSDGGTVGSLVRWVSSPTTLARPSAGLVGFGQPGSLGARMPAAAAAPVKLSPGKHLAVAMIPVGGATKTHPALFVIGAKRGKPPVAILSTSAPAPAGAPVASSATAGSGSTTSTSAGGSTPSNPSDATAFPFALPKPPGPGGTQALATNTKDGGVTYDIAYALVDVSGGANVTNTNSAYALAHCHACTTVAVSFQVVLVVGESKNIAPINAAGALNYDCPACTTTALADQIVVTLKAQPSAQLIATLENDLKQLNALPALGAGGTPTAVASEVATVQQEIDSALQSSGLETNPPGSSSTTSTGTTSTGTASTPTVHTTPSPTTPTSPTTPASPTGTGQSTTPATTGSPSSTSTSTTAPPPATSSTSTSTTPSSTSGSAASQSGGATTATTSTTPGG
jgi:putative peptide zinc metalloprotease protein